MEGQEPGGFPFQGKVGYNSEQAGEGGSCRGSASSSTKGIFLLVNLLRHLDRVVDGVMRRQSHGPQKGKDDHEIR